MKYFLSILFISIFFGKVHGQDPYSVARIPPELLQNASVVVRNEVQVFDIKSVNSAQYNYKIAFTILNEAGEGFNDFYESYDNFSSISNIKATMYDPLGRQIKEYKSADIKDEALLSSMNIYDDQRIKKIKFTHIAYPYTIEYSFTQDFKGFLSIPSWKDIKGYHVSVEKSSYAILKNKDYALRILTSKNLYTDSSSQGSKIVYQWTSTNIPALVREPMSTGYDNLARWVKVAPNVINFDHSTGNFTDWKNFGSWIYDLNLNGQILPETTKAQVQNLTKDAKTPKEKMAILYKYLQENTRYVSVQLGIGGFRPIVAEKVALVNYGDCKGLSNYMKALLNAADIPSNLIVIGNDMPSLNRNFSSIGQANHMILAVPFEKDTTFLECTSQHSPMGFIGDGSADRDVLMITKDGGKVVHTPVYSAKDNAQLRKATIDFTEDGNAAIQIKTDYAFAQFENNFRLLLEEPTEQRKAILERNNIPGAELLTYHLTQADKTVPKMTEELNFSSKQLFSKGGEKYFLLLNQTNRMESVPLAVEERKTNFSISFSYLDEDEIYYTLPKGFAVEFTPKDCVINSEFGTYSAKAVLKDNSITYIRSLRMNKKQYPPEKYKEYVDFMKKVYTSDKQKAVLSKTDKS
ncbi:DUF3857 domain-containing protein [Pedobacter sp. MW01-1-1]|uniref:DUF3857 domain-containing protein n=1 Tax=Pedobacter sp. MW01-1-1 TaxID=3383027 RepID=UPI003FEE2925